MSATKILWGQLLAVSLIVVFTTWGATQYVAWKLGFQGQLGTPWFEVAGWPIYYPPAFFWWWYFYDAYAPNVFLHGAVIAASGGFLSIAVAIGMSVWRAREAKRVETYGSARWAERQEVRAANLFNPDGVILGCYEENYLRHDGPEHVLCFAPTRSGKGVGLVVPSLLTWPGSAIVHDIKEKTGSSPPVSARSTVGCCCSTPPTRNRPPTIRCSKSAAANGKCGTFRTSRTSWWIRKGRSKSGTTGRRRPMRFSSARSCMSSMPRRTRHWRVSRLSCPTLNVRSSRPCPR